ncbi:hypothetical protein C0Q70_14113 [Pomacea canaliculata]|uniref:Uncharacterized protein n=1 Tax=Pomacea canaliculata TaxID=400727 RepID=A0A2T7NZ50_POMCA|nr:hypothetical protein C0Q70_14113 [Pomacea canaliculata]
MNVHGNSSAEVPPHIISPLSSICVSAASNKNRDVRVAAPVFQDGASITVARGLVAQRLSPL